MALFGFLSNGKATARCTRCNTPLKEDDVRRHNGQIYCDFCLVRVRDEEKAQGSRPARPNPIVDSVGSSSGTHPAIQEIKVAFDAAKIHYSVHHIGDQWELVAAVSGKANNYQIKFISKDGGKNDVALRIFSLVHISASNRPQTLAVLNSFQRKYRFLRFTLDTDDDVKVEYDMPSCTTDIGGAAVEMMLRTMKMIDDIYPELMRCVWG